jgi:heme/copper-type cytochrome/quinol oxidase subunit 2
LLPQRTTLIDPLLHMTRTRTEHRKVLRLATALFAGLGLVLMSGCKLAEVFSLSGPQSTMVTSGPVAKAQWDLFMITVYVTMFIFVVVGAVLAYAQIKFRAKSESDTILKNAERQIEQQTTRAVQQIRQEAVDMSVAIASKILQRNISKEDNQKLIDDALKQIESIPRSH